MRFLFDAAYAYCENSEIIAYVPVINRAYKEFFERYDTQGISVIAYDVLEKNRPAQKDRRALYPEEVVEIIRAMYPLRIVRTVGYAAIKKTTYNGTRLILPRDDISIDIVEKLELSADQYHFDDIFLRWNRQNVDQNVMCLVTKILQ